MAEERSNGNGYQGEPRSLVAEIRQNVCLVELAREYCDLIETGNRFVAVCPWHDDDRPSLTICPHRNTWVCWVCNIRGDVLDFFAKFNKVEYQTAVSVLAMRLPKS